MELQELVFAIKEKGGRLTPQRRLIAQLLIEHQHCLLKVDDLLKLAKDISPDINATTLYRNLELLDQLKLLYTQNDNDGSKAYKLICHHAHHHHIICTNCGKMLPIDYCPIEPQLEALLTKEGFILESHRLELLGCCKECQEAKFSNT